MSKSQYKREDLYKVIIVYIGGDGLTKFAKYRNILVDRPASWKISEAFFRRKFPTATHANVYGGISGNFKKQIPFI